jgi:Tol biopolymer transport system component
MSPEQAAGKKIDSRSDIFSFGSVLYEMLTRRRAFQRETATSTLAAIIAEEPEPVSRAAGDLPPELERVIERCLRKDPQRRWQSMSDLRVVLQDLKEDSDSGKLRPVAAIPRRQSRWGWWAALAAGLAGVGAVLTWVIVSRQPPATGIAVTRMTFDTGSTWSPTISPDGRLLAYASDRAQPGNLDIWVQQVAGGQPLRLTSDPATDWSPSFSADGSRIAFRSERDGGGLYVIDTLGGDARRISDRGFIPLFSPDGSQICFVDIPPSLDPALNTIHLIAAQGGPSRPFQPDFSVNRADISSHPIWSPDGRSLLFLGFRGGDLATTDWWIAPIDGGPPTRVAALRQLSIDLPWGFPRAWTNGFIYYVTGSTVEGLNIFRVAFDAGRQQIAAKPEPLTVGGGMKWDAAVSRDGRMVYSHLTWTLNVWGAAIQADRGKVAGEMEPITSDETVKFSPRLSRNGSVLAYSAFSGLYTRGAEIRMRHLSTGRETALPPVKDTTDPAPVISADGAVLAYRQVIAGRSAYYVRTPGSASDRQLCEDCVVYDFFSDPSFALVRYGPRELVRQQVATGDRTTVLHVDEGSIFDARLSWDDRWIAFLLGLPSGLPAIYVAPLPGAPTPNGERILVRKDDHVLGSPRWSPDGRWLYYMSAADGFMCVWGQPLDAVSRKPVGPPVGIEHFHGSRASSFPLNRGSLEVASNRLVLILGESKGNVWMAQLDRW